MMAGHYFDRKGDTTLCEPCADKRWGDPQHGNTAANNRHNDRSGEWCWAPWLAGNLPCDACGVVVR